MYSTGDCHVSQYAADTRGASDKLRCCNVLPRTIGHPPELQYGNPVVWLIEEGKGRVVHEDCPAQVAAEPAQVFDAGVDLGSGGGGAVQAAPLEAVPAGGWRVSTLGETSRLPWKQSLQVGGGLALLERPADAPGSSPLCLQVGGGLAL